jgi:hypothetical protein
MSRAVLLKSCPARLSAAGGEARGIADRVLGRVRACVRASLRARARTRTRLCVRVRACACVRGRELRSCVRRAATLGQCASKIRSHASVVRSAFLYRCAARPHARSITSQSCAMRARARIAVHAHAHSHSYPIFRCVLPLIPNYPYPFFRLCMPLYREHPYIRHERSRRRARASTRTRTGHARQDCRWAASSHRPPAPSTQRRKRDTGPADRPKRAALTPTQRAAESACRCGCLLGRDARLWPCLSGKLFRSSSLLEKKRYLRCGGCVPRSGSGMRASTRLRTLRALPRVCFACSGRAV